MQRRKQWVLIMQEELGCCMMTSTRQQYKNVFILPCLFLGLHTSVLPGLAGVTNAT